MLVLQIVDNTYIPLFAFRAAFLRTYLHFETLRMEACGWI